MQPLSLKALTTLIATLCCTVAVFLSLGEYARKETVSGYLEPTTGFVDIYNNSNANVVQQVYVQNGQWVEKGTPLVELASPQARLDGQDVGVAILAELESRENSVVEQLEQNEIYFEREAARLGQQEQQLMAELVQQQQLRTLQQARVGVNAQMLSAMNKLRATGGVSEFRLLQVTAEKLEQEKEMVTITQRLAQLDSALTSLRVDLVQLPGERLRRASQLWLQKSTIRQQIQETAAQRERLILAPVSGEVSGLQAHAGVSVVPGLPLLSLVSNSANLHSVLLVPSTAAGFLTPNQPVRLMFDAYPYQQFGTHPAVLQSVSASPIAAGDLRAPISVQGPVFVASAALSSNRITVMGESRLLQPGLLLRADIVLEKRSLFDWLLAPLYSLRGRT